MKIDIITLFPKMFIGPFSESLISRAQKKGLVKTKIHNLRDWAKNKHKTVDDTPYGGGAGMVIKVDVLHKALSTLKSKVSAKGGSPPKADAPREHASGGKNKKSKIILLTPQGKPFKQKDAKRLSREKHLILIAGHYEGFDERIRKHLTDEEISIGDYILTGGELPAMVIVDAVVRLIPGVVGKKESVRNESFSVYCSRSESDENYKTSHPDRHRGSKNKKITLLDHPVYTKPVKYNNWSVPKILLSGNHKKIEDWRKKKAVEKTKTKRPDLL